MEPGQEGKIRAFTAIEYEGVRQISYLQDFKAMDPGHEAFVESVSRNEAVSNGKKHSAFDNIGDLLERKILKQGYIEKPSKVNRKGKKGDADVNFYNPTDDFINDDECCIEKKDKTSSFEDYACATMSIEALYASQMYRDKVSDVVEEATQKRKAPDQFDPNNEQDAHTYDEVKKKIIKFIQNSQSASKPSEIAPAPPPKEAKEPQVVEIKQPETAEVKPSEVEVEQVPEKEEQPSKPSTGEKSGSGEVEVVVID